MIAIYMPQGVGTPHAIFSSSHGISPSQCNAQWINRPHHLSHSSLGNCDATASELGLHITVSKIRLELHNGGNLVLEFHVRDDREAVRNAEIKLPGKIRNSQNSSIN